MFSEERKEYIQIMSQTDFIIQLKQKDEEAFHKLYDRYVHLIYHIAYSYTRNVEDAEDIVSDVFVRIVHSINQYQEKGKFKEWICQITRNIALNYITRNKEKDTILSDELVSVTADTSSNHQEMMDLFCEHLEEDIVRIMVLRFIYDYKFKDIACCLGMTIGKVQGLYYDGLEILRRVYKI